MVLDLPDPLEAFPPEEAACENDVLSVGFLPGEGAALVIRSLATVITTSIFSAWCGDRAKIRRKLLFFTHWASGLVYVLSEWMMAMMILACWSKEGLVWVIKLFKFVELTADNMLAITNLAICVQLALIVSNAYTMAPVRSIGSPKMVLIMIGLSALIPATAAPMWQKRLITTGTQFWLESGPTQSSNAWVTISQFLLELCIACAMLFVVGALLATRRLELRKCWQAHARIKYYFGLSCIAVAVNLVIGVGGLLWVSWKRDPRFLVVGWCMRYLHIALDTIVLYGVLVNTPATEKMGGDGDEEQNASTGPARDPSDDPGPGCCEKELNVAPVDRNIGRVASIIPRNGGGSSSPKSHMVSSASKMLRAWPMFKGERKVEDCPVWPREPAAIHNGMFSGI